MSVLRSRPALRWLVPTAAAVLVIGGGAAAGTLVASAEPSLPARSAAQLLVDVQNARVEGLSGTVVEHADLGLPALSGLTGQSTGGVDIMKLITGNNTARVWYAGENKARIALMSTLGQTDIIRNGTDVWVWQSRDNTAEHLKLSADADTHADGGLPAKAGQLGSTPQDAAAMALAAIDPTTAVSTSGAAKVAGRSAYELVLAPRDTASLVGQVRLAIDAKEHIPLRVEVYPKNANAPAASVAFEQISFATPDAQQFAFNPPPNTKVTEHGGAAEQGEAAKGPQRAPVARPGLTADKVEPQKAEKKPAAGKDGAEPTVVGKGWTSVLVAKASQAELSATGKSDNPIQTVLAGLPKVSGAWGTGRLLSGNLFSVLLVDDGRILLGAVAPEKLYEIAGR